MPKANQLYQARSAVGVAVRRRDPAAELVARRDLAAAKIAKYIERTVSAAPSLTSAQRDSLAMLLRGGGAP